MNYCKDCKWYQFDQFLGFGYCYHELSREHDPVGGGPAPASMMRRGMSSDHCGKEGKWFEPKEKECNG